jgi:tRNA(Ile)-lysidine synthase
MPARRTLAEDVTLIRPLLSLSRREIREYLDSAGQQYQEDATNSDMSRTRARIRHDLLPKLAREYNPKVADALVRLAKHAGRHYFGLKRSLVGVEPRVILSTARDRLVLDREALLSLPPETQTELIREAWTRLGWPEGLMGAKQWSLLTEWATTGQSGASLGNAVRVEVSRETVSLSRSSESGETVAEECLLLSIPGSATWLGGCLSITLNDAEPRDETIDRDALEPPLFLSAPRPGDRFDPLGLGGHHQAIGDFLRIRHIPRDERDRVPLLRDQRGIVWVVGHRISHRVRRTEATRRHLGLRWEPLS